MIAGKVFQDLLCQVAVVSALLICGISGAQANEIADEKSCTYFAREFDDRSGPPIHFYANLSDDEQSAPTVSPGTGRAEFVLERDTLTLSWRVSYTNLTTAPIALHIHGPKAPAVDAPILFDATPKSFGSPVEGERILSLGEATNLIQHLLYLNLQTSKYPEGELRGRIKKVRPNC